VDKYIGVKIIHAEPMTRGDYNKFKGWTIPQDEDPNDEGYLVKYKDGYISWSPKGIFEDSNRKTDGMTFGLAVEALKKGFKVCRKGWNGKGMWAVMQKGYPNGININKNTAEATGMPEGTLMKFRPYFMLFTAQSDFAHWVPSGSDILADDWQIID